MYNVHQFIVHCLIRLDPLDSPNIEKDKNAPVKKYVEYTFARNNCKCSLVTPALTLRMFVIIACLYKR